MRFFFASLLRLVAAILWFPLDARRFGREVVLLFIGRSLNALGILTLTVTAPIFTKPLCTTTAGRANSKNICFGFVKFILYDKGAGGLTGQI